MDSLLPFLQGTCTPYNMPVYPGARRVGGDTPGRQLFSVVDVYDATSHLVDLGCHGSAHHNKPVIARPPKSSIDDPVIASQTRMKGSLSLDVTLPINRDKDSFSDPNRG